MLVQSLYPIYAILGGGLGCYFLLQRWFQFEWRHTEIFHFSIIIGSFFLIVPWTFIGIQPDGILRFTIIEEILVFSIPFASYIIACYGIFLLLALYASFHLLRLFIQKLETLNGDIILKPLTFDIILIVLLIGEYFVLQLFLPLRGFDALYYYFPEAEVFYLADHITDINYLSFSPVVKAPFNVMLFTFSLYISNQNTYQMYPLLFLIGSSLLVYDLSMELWGEKIKARLAMLVFLVTPVVFWTMTFWAYYQDLYVGYFFGAAFYFVWKGMNRSKKYSRGFTILSIMSMALALLSKISAWTLFIVLVLALPAKRTGRVLQLLILMILTSFLIARSITNIFIGTGIIILLFATFIGYLIVKRPIPEKNPSFTSLIAFFIGSIILGGFWMFDRVNKSSEFLNELISLYFTVLDSIAWEFNGSPTFTLDAKLESMQAVNFWSASFFFFMGIAFCLPWIVPKVLALIRGTEIATISIWVLAFFMIWMTYYFQGSIRYLSPIFIPFAILIVHGFQTLIEHFNISLEAKLPRIGLLLFGCINFYYLIPLDFTILDENSQELVGLTYNRSAFSYYSEPEIAIIQALFFAIVWIGLIIITSDKLIKLPLGTMNFSQDWKKALSSNNIRRIRTGLTSVFLITVVLTPIVVQGYVWLQSSGDLETFQGIMEYEYNEDYKAIIEQINQFGSITGAIITVRMPGLQFFTHHPVLDFYYQGNLLGNQFYSSQNISHLVEVLKHPMWNLLSPKYNQSSSFELSFEFIVVPNTRNIYFDLYRENIWSKSYFFKSLNNKTYFELLEENDRYQLFKIT